MRVPHKLGLLVGALAALSVGVALDRLGAGRAPDRVVFLAVGQGDCTLIQVGGRTLLVDAGPRTERFDGGERLVVPALRRLGVRRIDAVLLTHPDGDHLGGLPAIARRFPVGEVWVSREFEHSEELRSALAEARERPVWLPSAASFQLGTARASLYCRPLAEGEEFNEGSCAMLLDTGKGRFVWTGDLGAEAEAELAERSDWRADVLKAGHHGSKGSNSAEWLAEVRPSVVVVSAGRGNRYGHPAQEVLDRVKAVGAKVLRTDRDGSIAFSLDGKPDSSLLR